MRPYDLRNLLKSTRSLWVIISDVLNPLSRAEVICVGGISE